MHTQPGLKLNCSGMDLHVGQSVQSPGGLLTQDYFKFPVCTFGGHTRSVNSSLKPACRLLIGNLHQNLSPISSFILKIKSKTQISQQPLRYSISLVYVMSLLSLRKPTLWRIFSFNAVLHLTRLPNLCTLHSSLLQPSLNLMTLEHHFVRE